MPPPWLGSDARAAVSGPRRAPEGVPRAASPHRPRRAHLGSKEGGGRAERRARARPREGRAEGGLGAVPAATDRGRFLDRAKQRVCRPQRGPLGRSVCRSFSTRTHKPDARGRAARAARKRAARGPRPGSVRGECDNKLGSGGGRRLGGRTRRRRKPQPRKMIRVVSASGFRHRRHRKVASSRACAAAAARARRGRDGPAACLGAPPLVGPPLLEGVEPSPASWYLRPRSIGAVGHSGSLQSGSEAELKGVVICFAARWAGRARARDGAPAVIRRPHQHWHGWRRGVESRSIIWGKKCCITSPPEEGAGGREAAGGRGPHRLGRRRASRRRRGPSDSHLRRECGQMWHMTGQPTGNAGPWDWFKCATTLSASI